jgi:adiponectin receptor
MVSTLESRYHDALQAQQTLAEKAHAGLLLLEDLLTDYESRALKLKQQGFSAAANQVIGGGRQMVDAGLHAAKEVMDEGINQALSAAASLEEHIAQGLARAKERGLIRFHDLPPPWQVNPHITRGYRFIHSEKKLHILLSVFGVSNETVNIWSHLIGLIIVISIAFYFYPSSANFSISTWEDKLIAAVFFFAAAKCLICSCMWHTYNCVANKTLLERFACVDYTGISFLIAASIMTTEYTAFYCEPISRWAYIATTFILGVAGVILPWHPTFNAKNMAWGRVAFYVSLALTGFVPIFQLSWTRGGAWAWHFYKPILSSIAVYGIGAVVYASKVPERWCPGMFDYVGGSHNLWHMAVLGGILFHYRAMERFFEVAFKRAGEGCIVY